MHTALGEAGSHGIQERGQVWWCLLVLRTAWATHGCALDVDLHLMSDIDAPIFLSVSVLLRLL